MSVRTQSNACNSAGAAVHEQDIVRRSANYLPNQWDYASIQNLTSSYTEEAYGCRATELKEEVRRLFDCNDPWAQLQLVDTIERLGLGYQFEKEINGVLSAVLLGGYDKVVQQNGLHPTATCFRLLRQHGFMASEEIFNHFKDENGSFMASLCQDVEGMLSLYQAAHLAFDGEKTLDAALKFAGSHLKEVACHGRGEVVHDLEPPAHWRLIRLEAPLYIDTYEKEEGMNPALLRLAKLDFNMVQNIHQNELRKVTSWWMSMGLANKLSFARDRILECFFVVICITFQPQYGYCREWLTKVGTLIVTIDDVYDVYGSLDELELFTRAVERWDIKETENLPNYMKICFATIHDVVNEIACGIQTYNECEVLPHLKKVWADLCNAFLVEARWHNNKYVPSLKEYLDNGWTSVSGPVILIHTYFLQRHKLTQEALKLLKSRSSLIRSSSLIFRLCNDLATSAEEQERGDAPSSIQCYMNESGVSEVVAREHIKSIISQTWKEMNKEIVDCSVFPPSFVDSCVNLARMALCLYRHRDSFGDPSYEIKCYIKSLLMEPIAFVEGSPY